MPNLYGKIVKSASLKGSVNSRGRDGASAYEIAVANGFSGTEDEWLASLHSQDDVARNAADYAKLYAEKLNSGENIPLDTTWEKGGCNSYGSNDSRSYRARSAGYMRTFTATALQAADGYQFFAVVRGLDNTYLTTTDWTTLYTVPVDRLYRICIRAYPESASITADPQTFGAAITIVNNIGSATCGVGGSVFFDFDVDDDDPALPVTPGSGVTISAIESAIGSNMVFARIHYESETETSYLHIAEFNSGYVTFSGGLYEDERVLELHGETLGGADNWIAKTEPALAYKLNKSQGIANAGKIMVVGSDGLIKAVSMAEWQNGDY